MARIRHGAAPSDAIDRLYSAGRSYPRSQPHETRHPATPRATGDISQTYHRHGEIQENQFFEDRHDEKAHYSNDASSWVRGARGEPTCNNETATNYPDGNFDRGNSWRLGREKSLNWNSGSDHREEFVKPGTEAEFEKRSKR
jgi:hypothetical protein